jgi:hypothetical protein
MNSHLYNLKKDCPATAQQVELTDEIKTCILKNRIFIPEPSLSTPAMATSTQTIFQTINQIHTINHFVSQMPTDKVIEHYLAHIKSVMISLDTHLASSFKSKVKRLESNPRSYTLKSDNFLETVNLASSISRIENMNILFSKSSQKISIYENNKWSSYLATQGVKKIMTAIQEAYFDVYEVYLIRKLYDYDLKGQTVARAEYEELLRVYYEFIVCFALGPFIHNKTNSEILTCVFSDDASIEDSEEEDESTSIYEKYSIYYTRADTSVTLQQKKNVAKSVLDIIKRNCAESVAALNAKVSDLFRMDESFKNRLSAGIGTLQS